MDIRTARLTAPASAWLEHLFAALCALGGAAAGFTIGARIGGSGAELLR